MLELIESDERRTAGDTTLELTLDWRPARDMAGPLTVEVRGHNLKTLITNRWDSVTCGQADA